MTEEEMLKELGIKEDDRLLLISDCESPVLTRAKAMRSSDNVLSLYDAHKETKIDTSTLCLLFLGERSYAVIKKSERKLTDIPEFKKLKYGDVIKIDKELFTLGQDGFFYNDQGLMCVDVINNLIFNSVKYKKMDLKRYLPKNTENFYFIDTQTHKVRAFSDVFKQSDPFDVFNDRFEFDDELLFDRDLTKKLTFEQAVFRQFLIDSGNYFPTRINAEANKEQFLEQS